MSFDKNNTEDMKAYLGYALEFEKYVYLWQNSLDNANNQIKQLTDERRKLQAQKKKSSQAISTVVTRTEKAAATYDKKAETMQARLSLCTKVIIIISLIYCIIPVVLMLTTQGMNPLYLLIAAVIYAVLMLTFYFLVRNHYKNRIDEIMEEKKKNASKQYVEYEKKMSNYAYEEAENKLIALSKKEPILNDQAMEISKNCRAAQATLNNIYSMNVLPVKYRNFVAVASLYEYLENGICTTIQGHGGIYDTYETALRDRIIINNLQQINESLSRIEANQQFLYYELQQANNTLATINSSLISIEKSNREIAQNTAISAVANKQTAETTKYLAWNAWANGY